MIYNGGTDVRLWDRHYLNGLSTKTNKHVYQLYNKRNRNDKRNVSVNVIGSYSSDDRDRKTLKKRSIFQVRRLRAADMNSHFSFV